MVTKAFFGKALQPGRVILVELVSPRKDSGRDLLHKLCTLMQKFGHCVQCLLGNPMRENPFIA
jgi:hypothetical protein